MNDNMEERAIRVTESEATFLALLEQFCKTERCPSKKPVRIAGGWVRDKLLNEACNDLDVALEDCTGETFAKSFRGYDKNS